MTSSPVPRPSRLLVLNKNEVIAKRGLDGPRHLPLALVNSGPCLLGQLESSVGKGPVQHLSRAPAQVAAAAADGVRAVQGQRRCRARRSRQWKATEMAAQRRGATVSKNALFSGILAVLHSLPGKQGASYNAQALAPGLAELRTTWLNLTGSCTTGSFPSSCVLRRA